MNYSNGVSQYTQKLQTLAYIYLYIYIKKKSKKKTQKNTYKAA